MNTIATRKDLLRRAMMNFEKGRDMNYIAGFYAAMVENLATDRQDSFEASLRLLKLNSIPAKYQK